MMSEKFYVIEERNKEGTCAPVIVYGYGHRDLEGARATMQTARGGRKVDFEIVQVIEAYSFEKRQI